MKIKEIIKGIKFYLIGIKTKNGKVCNTLICADNINDARLIADDIWGRKNILSVARISSIQNENVTQKQHQRILNIVSPDERHQQYQRILSKKYVKALQFPPITKDDRRIALKNAITYLKC